MLSSVKASVQRTYNECKNEFHTQIKTKQRNLLTACLLSVKNTHKNISFDRSVQKTMEYLTRARADIANLPTMATNDKGNAFLNENHVKSVVDLAKNMDKRIIAFESRYKGGPLSETRLNTYNDLKDKISEFKNNEAIRISKCEEDINRIAVCAKMVNYDTIVPILNAMFNQYNQLNESPVRTSTNLSAASVQSAFADIVNNNYSTPNLDMATTREQGNAAGQIIKRFLSSPRTVHIKDASIAKLEQSDFDAYMNQELQELPKEDREMTLSIYKAFATQLNTPSENNQLKMDVSSTFFGQAILTTSSFLESISTATENADVARAGVTSAGEATKSVYEKFLTYINRSLPVINSPA